LQGSDIRIASISKSFSTKVVLEDVNLDIKKGEFFSLLGPSGCGKTTLLRILGGFEVPDSGAIYIDGVSSLELPPNKRQINTVFQNYALFPHLNVFDNVAFALRIKNYKKAEIKAKVEEYLNLVKLDEHVTKFPSQLSGGQKQRVAIARALINEPKILLLDEPLSALDAKLRQHMLSELISIHDKTGITFVYVTHDQEEALSVSDRLAVIDQGRILQVDTPSEIYEKPDNKFIAEFIGDTNFVKGKVVDINDTTVVIDAGLSCSLFAYKDKDVNIGDSVVLTIRPEKIRIYKEKPEVEESKPFNILKCQVQNIIYTGSNSKYTVLSDSFNFKVTRQHGRYFMDDVQVGWDDVAFIRWHANDSFIIEVLKS